MKDVVGTGILIIMLIIYTFGATYAAVYVFTTLDGPEVFVFMHKICNYKYKCSFSDNINITSYSKIKYWCKESIQINELYGKC